MTPHARPHIETHSRGRGHSAVAGAAYRLGLALLDSRTGTRHTYTRRRRGEIVAAFTIAPEGSPSWATDPAECWNRAEAAERRRDAQVARDYRMPVPLGLDDQAAAAMARDMAEHIAARFEVPVSVGVHRDNARDALGHDKPDGKRGLHAHLYFPTRRLDGERYGAKLSELSNKNTSAPIVDALNERWASLANAYATRAGLVADYDHRAHARAGDDAEPTPTLGVAASAMERRGITTDKGDNMCCVIQRLKQVMRQTTTTSRVRLNARRDDQAPAERPGEAQLLPLVVPAAGGLDAERTYAERAFREASNTRDAVTRDYNLAHEDTKRSRERLEAWGGHSPHWFLFWLRPSWNIKRKRLEEALSRQEQRKKKARRASEKAEQVLRHQRDVLTALSEKSDATLTRDMPMSLGMKPNSPVRIPQQCARAPAPKSAISLGRSRRKGLK